MGRMGRLWCISHGVGDRVFRDLMGRFPCDAVAAFGFDGRLGWVGRVGRVGGVVDGDGLIL
jgi:hypothetical protein